MNKQKKRNKIKYLAYTDLKAYFECTLMLVYNSQLSISPNYCLLLLLIIEDLI